MPISIWPLSPPTHFVTAALAAISLTAIAALAAPPADTTLPADKSFMEYFLPTPIVGELSTKAWGADNVLPRDPQNGLEDPTIKQYCYWDGQIIKAPDGRYHMFASRWDQAKGHNGWFSSVAVHAVSDNVIGPYIDQGLCWPDDMNGKGHNVTALVMPDGTYAIIISETRPGTVFTSKSLDGPWTQLGEIKVDQPKWRASNYSMLARPDGKFEIVPRSGQILLSDQGILGPYKVMGRPVYPPGIPNLEDPVVFYTGGLYHIVVNSWSTRKAYHLTSTDGITNWTNHGIAYDPTADFIRYTNGVVNHWNKLERPSVLIENGHVVCMTFAALDVPKDQEKGNDNHGSKVIVVPFNGAALDHDLQPSPAPPQSQPH